MTGGATVGGVATGGAVADGAAPAGLLTDGAAATGAGMPGAVAAAGAMVGTRVSGGTAAGSTAAGGGAAFEAAAAGRGWAAGRFLVLSLGGARTSEVEAGAGGFGVCSCSPPSRICSGSIKSSEPSSAGGGCGGVAPPAPVPEPPRPPTDGSPGGSASMGASTGRSARSYPGALSLGLAGFMGENGPDLGPSCKSATSGNPKVDPATGARASQRAGSQIGTCPSLNRDPDPSSRVRGRDAAPVLRHIPYRARELNCGHDEGPRAARARELS